MALLVVVGAVVMWAISSRLERMAIETERMAMEMTVTNLRTGLRWREVNRQLSGQRYDVFLTNPVELIESAPPNYSGMVAGADIAAVAPGNWYFDRGIRQLCYRPRAIAQVEMKGQAICFALRRVAEGDVVLVTTTPYRWK
ncbi:hypothetical protein [Niveibacterium umoris]|uniref:Uncharacterized protein n=1 Tax=Niveibacterium umoris TaxID=1193620 RepID=A0A840BLI3_9RHOO|nr:hypothetical protein [Niveibacterium umoris]MBB4012502.1 hypothetical protein [Niveibacterium umoris]